MTKSDHFQDALILWYFGCRESCKDPVSREVDVRKRSVWYLSHPPCADARCHAIGLP